MKVREAVKITGSMTRTNKMPGLSYSLPAWECQVGAKLRAVKGSVCSGCYALKGNYKNNEIFFFMLNLNFAKLPWDGKATF